MKITIEQAVAMFSVVKAVNLKESKNVTDKVTLLWMRLYPFNKKWVDLQADIQKEVEEIRKPFAEEMQSLSEEERKAKEQEINQKFQEKLNELPSVKGQTEMLKEVVEVDLPTITEDEFKSIASSFKSLAEVTPLYELLEVK